MVCTKMSTMCPGSAAPTRPERLSVALIGRSSPGRSTSEGGHEQAPAMATSLELASVTSIRSRPCDPGVTESAPLVGEDDDVEHCHVPSRGGSFRTHQMPHGVGRTTPRGYPKPPIG